MEEIINAFQANPIFSTGCIIFIIGVLIFCFGRKLFFGQLFWGLILSGIGLAIIVYYRM